MDGQPNRESLSMQRLEDAKDNSMDIIVEKPVISLFITDVGCTDRLMD